MRGKTLRSATLTRYPARAKRSTVDDCKLPLGKPRRSVVGGKRSVMWIGWLCFDFFLGAPALLSSGGGAEDGEEAVALFVLDVVLDEALRLLQVRLLVDDLLLAQVTEHLVVERHGVAVEAIQHHVRLDERVDVRELAEELARVALADRLQPVEDQSVLALEDVVQRLRDHRHALLDGRVALAEQLLDLQVGGDAELVEVDELLVDRLHRVIGAVVGDVEAHRAAHEGLERVHRLARLGLVFLEQLAIERAEFFGVFRGVLHSAFASLLSFAPASSSCGGCSCAIPSLSNGTPAAAARSASSSRTLRSRSRTAISFFSCSSMWNLRYGACRSDRTFVSFVRIIPAECFNAFRAAFCCPSVPMIVT